MKTLKSIVAVSIFGLFLSVPFTTAVSAPPAGIYKYCTQCRCYVAQPSNTKLDVCTGRPLPK